MNLARRGKFGFERRRVNTEEICSGIEDVLKSNGKNKENARLLFLGVHYNADIGALEVMDSFCGEKGDTAYFDPYKSCITTANGVSYNCVELSDEKISNADCVVFTADHSCFNVKEIVKKANLVVDFRDATRFIDGGGKITRL